MLKPCTVCGEPSEQSRCGEHRADQRAKPRLSRNARGYGWRWEALSKRARKLQPFCSDCGSTEDLSADHSPEAWERYAAGLPIRLADIDVVCRPCNAKRGRARPSET